MQTQRQAGGGNLKQTLMKHISSPNVKIQKKLKIATASKTGTKRKHSERGTGTQEVEELQN